MSQLQSTLEKMQEVLSTLTDLLAEEQNALAAGKVNSNLLQRITEDKRSLLATLNYLDQMRLTCERSHNMTAPYPADRMMAEQWQRLQQATRQLRDANVHNGLLLQQQIRFTDAAVSVLKPHFSQAFYGPDGLGTGRTTLSHKA
ncbi:flagella synthesis protein FlgN [Pantoea sp. A4]|uniref:flagella synthesis protein FlgN n=1 Tax=Pantoea sp. A4 TaxID=1225184 RepID=UPI0003816A18|nr:flagellar export chaperone FlgN [Pantoea sp. A4]